MKKVQLKMLAEMSKDNAPYLLKDNAFGNNLVLSSTFLRATKKQMDIHIRARRSLLLCRWRR